MIVHNLFASGMAEVMNQAVSTLDGLLKWLSGSDGGAFILVSWLIAWGLEKASFWQKIQSNIKILIMLFVAGILGALSNIMLMHPEIVAIIDPYIRPFMYSVMAWLASQTAHAANPLRIARVK